MVQLYDGGAYLVNQTELVPEAEAARVEQLTGKSVTKEEAKKGTIAYSILKAHNTSGNMENLQIKFDALTSHDITFVGIIQTAKASGMERFPIPYVLTNCHNHQRGRPHVRIVRSQKVRRHLRSPPHRRHPPVYEGDDGRRRQNDPGL